MIWVVRESQDQGETTCKNHFEMGYQAELYVETALEFAAEMGGEIKVTAVENSLVVQWAGKNKCRFCQKTGAELFAPGTLTARYRSFFPD